MSENIIYKLLEQRPILKEFFERSVVSYVLSRSPAVNEYVRRISKLTGLPEEVVRNSQPVRNYLKSLLGF